MTKLTLLLDRKEILVRPDAGAIRIDSPGQKLQRIPVKMIEAVIITGSPVVACGVWRLLAKENVPAVILPSRGTGPAVYVGAGLSGSALKRVLQYKLFHDTQKSLTIARSFIHRKLGNQEILLNEMGIEMQAVKEGLHVLKTKLADAQDTQSIMGLEGAGSAFYFKCLKTIVNKKWKFLKRNRRPPKDPVNALLSLGYTLAAAEIRGGLLSSGFDPSTGFLHSLVPGRDSLVLDFLEPARPAVDRFVINLLKNEKLSTTHFINNTADGCRLNKSGRAIFYPAWAYWKTQGILKSHIQTSLDILNHT
jgi:CRISPR-associated protein Cas1